MSGKAASEVAKAVRKAEPTIVRTVKVAAAEAKAALTKAKPVKFSGLDVSAESCWMSA